MKIVDCIYKYGAFTSNALKRKYTYRFQSFMWSLSMLFNMLVQYYLWKSIYAETSGEFMGMLEQKHMIYICLGSILYNIISCMENMNIAEDIKTGNIVMSLCKPLDYKIMVFFRHLGSKIGEILGIIPIIIIIILRFIDCRFITLYNICFFIISMILAMILFFLFSYIMGILTFWTINYWGIQFFCNTIIGLCSGQLIAINFYLEIGKGKHIYINGAGFFNNSFITFFFGILGKIAYCLPFQSMYHTPMSILSGMFKDTNIIIFHIILQVFWIIFLSVVINVLWFKAQRKIEIYGG